jgi:predicted GNAT family N-acyltransferase
VKYLKYFETRETPKEILDLFSNRIQNIDLDDNLEMSVERTKGSYKIIIINKLTNKTIARLYIQSIKEKNGKYHAEVRRVHVNDEYREKGLGSKLMQKVIDVFGDLNLYLYPSPNRIKDLSDTNREDYRNRLVNFYGKYGFKKVGDTNRMERFNENNYNL